jgi:ABC-2 type transport system ATP-binding protein
MPPADTPLLETHGLTKDYGPARALDGLTLTIRRGEVFGLLGPNGSGKSTALRLVLGFLRPTAGSARVGGRDCWRDSVAVRRQVAYLPGELRLYETMTGRQLVRFLERLRGQPLDAEADALARRLDVPLDRPLIQMSSGMKRKVALLTVLLPPVPLVILDEPTNTLDPTMRDELLAQLRSARGRGQTVVFSSHVLAEVEQVCDRVGILRRGQLVHLQEMAELREGRHITVSFAREPGESDWPPGLTLRSRRPGGGYELEYRGPLPPLLEWLKAHDPTELRIEPLGLSGIYHRYHGSLE